MNRIAVTVVALPLLIAGCSPGETAATPTKRSEAKAAHASPGAMPASPAEAARETLAAMLEAAEAGNWASYVDNFYGESHKFSSPSDRQQLIDRFEASWGSQVVEGLRQMNSIEPEISSDGSQAVFQAETGGQFTLHRDADGKWTFHL